LGLEVSVVVKIVEEDVKMGFFSMNIDEFLDGKMKNRVKYKGINSYLVL